MVMVLGKGGGEKSFLSLSARGRVSTRINWKTENINIIIKQYKNIKIINLFFFIKTIVAKKCGEHVIAHFSARSFSGKIRPMEIKIEKLTFQDLDLFWQVFSKVLQTDFPGYTKAVVDYFLNKAYTRANFNYWLSTDWKIVLAAKAEAGIIGFAVLDKPYGGVCFCRWLGVLAEFRNQGVGKKLIEAWLNYAKNSGCHKAEVASQPEAKDFYKKCNLDLEGKRKLSYFGIDQYIFGRVINQPRDMIMTAG